jgi:hypothetical protein
MPAVDPYLHMEEAWGLESNPFPAGAIRVIGKAQPYSPDVFPEETQEFRRKFGRGMLMGSTSIGFLWSQGARNDTGYGKTTLLQAMRNEVNRDLGFSTLTLAGMKPDKARLIASALSSLNTLQATGLYPVLFNAVSDLCVPNPTGGPSVLDMAKQRIVDAGAGSPAEIAHQVRSAWLDIAPGGAPLRPELVDAFAIGGGGATLGVLQQVSEATRLRAGLQYIDFALAALAAAGVERLILMIDQLEDLATNRAVSAAKRSKEVGRIRDLLEQAPYATHLRMVFTFHNRAAQVLERFWESNRLPGYEPTVENSPAIVVLRGLEDDERAAELLRCYLSQARIGSVEHDLLPLDMGAVRVLREVAENRPGMLLAGASKILDHAALENAPTINSTYVRRFFSGELDTGGDFADDADVVDHNVDDILLG